MSFSELSEISRRILTILDVSIQKKDGGKHFQQQDAADVASSSSPTRNGSPANSPSSMHRRRDAAAAADVRSTETASRAANKPESLAAANTVLDIQVQLLPIIGTIITPLSHTLVFTLNITLTLAIYTRSG